MEAQNDAQSLLLQNPSNFVVSGLLEVSPTRHPIVCSYEFQWNAEIGILVKSQLILQSNTKLICSAPKCRRFES